MNTRSNAIAGQKVLLSIQFYGMDNSEIDPDSTPTIEITDSNGTVIVSETITNVERSSDGYFQYEYLVPSLATEGLWTDTWTGEIDGIIVKNSFQFFVTNEASTSTGSSGSVTLGDDVNFDFSDEEIIGINVLLKYLKARLRSSGKRPKRDEYGAMLYDGYGEVITEECNVFSDEILICFLCQALSEFNMVPFFTDFKFSDEIIYKMFSSVIVEAAYTTAIASQALVEKGRDFTISDGGLSYQPPALGDFLQSHFSTWLSSYRERLKFIKNSIRPGPRGYGTYSNIGSSSPAITRLRHLRARRII